LNILITGGTGLVGTRLTKLSVEAGHSVAHLSRASRPGATKTFVWDPKKKTLDSAALAMADVVVHLAGTNVGDKRWSDRRKEDILKSRIDSTSLLFEELRKGNHNVKSFVSASGIGYYGAGDEGLSFSEDHKKGDGFLADVVARWEEAVDEIATLSIRVVKIRTGVVLSEKGGALKEMMRPIKLYVGSPLGTGDQIVSWIHLDDLCRIFIKAAEDQKMQGVYNAVAPNPVSNKQLTSLIAQTLKRPLWLPRVPAFILSALLGEMSEVVLEGSKISSAKIQATGFTFRFTNPRDALQDLLAG
jgi:uncharacterized protein